MSLTGKDRRHLRGLAHHLDPVVLTGANGISEAVIAKVSVELEQHELIKVRVSPDGPVGASDAAPGLAEATGAEVIQVIGHIVVLYRRAKERKVYLADEKPPKPRRPHASETKLSRNSGLSRRSELSRGAARGMARGASKGGAGGGRGGRGGGGGGRGPRGGSR